jgi:hypothetical protein
MTKNNCLCWALPRFLTRAKHGEETYLIFRASRVRWGFFHVLIGKLDPETGQIVVSSYKPPDGHQKTGFAPTFKGDVVDGDKPPVR